MSDPINPFASGSNSPLANSPFAESNQTQVVSSQHQPAPETKPVEPELPEDNTSNSVTPVFPEAKVRDVLRNGMDSQQVEKALLKLKEVFNF